MAGSGSGGRYEAALPQDAEAVLRALGGSMPWMPGISYKRGQTLVHEGVSYVCTSTHTAGVFLDPSKFVTLGGSFRKQLSYSASMMSPGGPAASVSPGPVFERATAEGIGGWSLDPTSTEAVVVLAGGLPPEWRGKTVQIDVRYSAPDGSTVSISTAVSWRVDQTDLADDSAANGAAPTWSIGSAVHAVKLRSTSRMQRVRLPYTFTANPDVTRALRINRMGADAGDTFASDVRLHEVILSVAESSTSDPVVLANASRSWWTTPAVLRTPAGDLISSGSAQNGKGSIVAGKVTRSGVNTEFTLSNLSVLDMDEHNVSAFVRHPTSGLILSAYTRHGADAIVNTRISATADAVDFGSTVNITFGTTVTYVQMYHVSADVVWLFTRTDNGWSLSITTDFGLTWSAPKDVILFPGSDKGYMIGRLVSGKIRIAMCGHPVNSVLHDICVGQIDVATGAIQKPDGTLIDNINTMVTPVDVGVSFDHAYVHSGGGSSRLFDIGDGPEWEVVFCTWTTDGNSLGVGNDAVYRYMRLRSGTWQISAGVVAAGRIIGYLNTVHYHGGCSIPMSSPGSTFLSCREDVSSGYWVLEQWTNTGGIDAWTSTPIRATRRKIYRPVATAAGTDGYRGLSWNEAEYYDDFGKYLSKIVGVHDFTLV